MSTSPLSPSIAPETMTPPIENHILSPVNQLIIKGQELANKIKTSAKQIFDFLTNHLVTIPLPRIAASVAVIADDTERLFNFAGCIPVVAIMSGTIRSIIGHIQLIIGAAAIALAQLSKQMIANEDPQNSEAIKAWDFVIALGKEHVLQGALNALRGGCEALFGTTGSLLLLIPNLYQGKSFASYCTYKRTFTIST